MNIIEKKVALLIGVNEEGEVLVGRRTDNGRLALPGGGVEEDEEINKAAIRELAEETGMTLEQVYYLMNLQVSGLDISYFYGRLIGDAQVNLAEFSELLYITPDQANQMQLAYEHGEVLANFFRSVWYETNFSSVKKQN